MTTSIPVLDNGFVRLVDHMGNDLSIVRAARVSYNADWRVGNDAGSDQRLIGYLWTHKHTSPFEAVQFQFEVKAPIFVFRQWHRHRTWSFNELSARYSEMEEEFYVPEPGVIGLQSQTNKQARVIDGGASQERMQQVETYEESCRHSFEIYRNLLSAGWPRELARCCLPLSTYSRMFASVNLLNLMRFMTLRCEQHAQFEIRAYAIALRDLVREIVPIAMAAWAKSEEF
jgi:thymidylate synthase (FAD)